MVEELLDFARHRIRPHEAGRLRLFDMSMQSCMKRSICMKICCKKSGHPACCTTKMWMQTYYDQRRSPPHEAGVSEYSWTTPRNTARATASRSDIDAVNVTAATSSTIEVRDCGQSAFPERRAAVRQGEVLQGVSSKQRGSGIGLAVTDEIVSHARRHAERRVSIYGEGTTVTDYAAARQHRRRALRIAGTRVRRSRRRRTS